jgi:hypothetical protein
MIESTEMQSSDRTRLIITGVCLFLALLLVLIFLLSHRQRPLKPLRTGETAELLFVSNEVNLVSFSELNTAPEAYLDQFIRVSGSYTPQPPLDCLPHSGPDIRWALINDELQLDAIGFENIMREVPPGTIITVVGIWRRYEGPYGCGKEPPTNVAWYLEVTQILEPNPLFGADSIALDTLLGPSRTPVGPEPTLTPVTVQPTPTLEPGTTAVVTPTATITALPTIGTLATLTPTTAVGTVTPTPTLGTPTPSGTPTITPSPLPPGTASVTPTITPTSGAIPPTTVGGTPNPYQGPATAAPTSSYP